MQKEHINHSKKKGRGHMGFFSSLKRSWNKSTRLQELQKIISPPGQTANDIISDVMSDIGGSNDKFERKKTALKEFLDLCESDEGVKNVMEIERISRDDLEQIYITLESSGSLGWIKGHYSPLSTIAYSEPLLYTVRSKKTGVNHFDILSNLQDYWSGKISQGGLLRKI